MSKKATRTTIIIFILILAVVTYYAYLSNRSREQKAETTMTKVESTLSTDLTRNYPATPKEVIKFYNEILRCLYNEECTDDEIEELCVKARELFDGELQAANETGTYLLQIESDIQESRDSNRRISSIVLASSTSVETYKKDGYSFAKLNCDYYITENGQTVENSLTYLLRKDDERRWKIYGWMDSAAVESLEAAAEGSAE